MASFPPASLSETRARLARLRQRRHSSGTSRNLFGSTSLDDNGGGLDVSPVQMGKELFHVLDANQLCMGRVGLGDKVCLKLPNSCEKTSHAKNKHTISDTSFIGLKASTQDVGHMSMILPTEELDGKMIEKLLNVEGEIDWISEFAKITKLEFEATGLGSHLLTQADLLPWLESHSTSCLFSIIPLDIEVRERFNIHRSFRRGATTRAKEMNVPESTIELNNRWRKVQNKQGGLPNLPMSQLYVEITQAFSSKLRFSKSL